MNQFRLAVATRCLGHSSLVGAIKSAAELNVTGVQFDIRNEIKSGHLSETGRRDLLYRINNRGLTVSGTVFPLQHPLYESERLDLRIHALRDAMRFAYSLKSTVVCFRVGKIPTEDNSPQRKVLIEVLNDLASLANHVGVTLAITPTRDSAESLKAVVEAVTKGPIGIDFDPAHFAMTGQPIAESLRLLHKLVVHVQLRDGVEGIDGGHEEVVGRGQVDWIEILALLGEMDYRGWLTAIRLQGEDRARDVAKGIKIVQRLLIGG